jgi:hypothetical protein
MRLLGRPAGQASADQRGGEIGGLRPRRRRGGLPPPIGVVPATLAAIDRIPATPPHPLLSPAAGLADRARRPYDLSRHLAPAFPAKLHLDTARR